MSQSTCPDPGASHILQPQVHNQGEPRPMPVSADPSSQARRRISSQNILSNTGSTGVQSSASLTSAESLFPGVWCTPILNALAHNLTTQNSMGGRQQVVPELLQQQLRQGFQYVYQQFLTLKCHKQESLEPTRVQSQMEQLRQQLRNLLLTTWQSSMQISSVIQPSMVQPANLSGLQQNQPFWTQQSAESKLQQDAHFHRWETPMMQQRHFMAQHPNATDMPQQNSVGDNSKQHQRLPVQQNNLGNLQQYEDWQKLIAQNNMANMQHTYLSAFYGFSTSQLNTMNALQLASGLNSVQGTVSAPLQANVTDFLSQSRVNMLQPNISLQENHHMHQQMLYYQQLKQQELMKQQRFNRQAKQHLPAQMQAHQMHQRNDFDRIKIRQEMGVKPDVFPQHISGGHGTPYTSQQMKPGASFHISSPPLLLAASSTTAIANEKRKAESEANADKKAKARKKK